MIDIDAETTEVEKIQDILLSYISPAYSNVKKKMLFMEQILDSLWNILERVPSERDTVFLCFVETIHPIVTNKRDYGYVNDILHSYLKNKFESSAVFAGFAGAMMDLLQNFMISQEDEQRLVYTSMCFGLILAFIDQSYEINRAESPDFDSGPFESLIRAVSEFLIKNTNERVKGYLYKSLFEVQTIELCCKFVNENELASLLTQEGSLMLKTTIDSFF